MIDPKEFERVLQERQRHKKLAQAEARDIRNAIDAEGKVRVWCYAEREFKRLWPVDAAEQIRLGLAVLNPVEMTDPDGAAAMVPGDAVEERRSEGWQVVGEEPTPESVAAPELAASDPEQAKGKRRSDRPAK